MQVEKTSSLKYSSVPKTIKQEQMRGINTNPSHAQSFGNVAGMMDMIDRGGLVASFLIQDFFGLNIPRTITGLYRNKDITGEYNYQEAAEVGLRECISGPIIFAAPMAMLYGAKRLFGKANNVPSKVLNVLGSNFSEQAAVMDKPEKLLDKAETKKSFYEDTFKNIFKNTYKENTPQEVIDTEAKRFTSDLLEYERMVNNKETKGFFDKLKGKPVPGTAEDKLAEMVTRFGEIKKANTSNASANFLEATVTSKDSSISKPISKLFGDMKNFIEDASDSVAKQAQKGVAQKDISEYIKKFTVVRAGSRALLNLSMIVGTIAVSSIVPKIYQLSSENPGTKGLENYTGEQAKENKATKKQQGKQVAFSGVLESVGKKVTQKKGFLSKLADEFEFDNYNVSFAGLLTVCGLGTLVPRLVTAREENEYKEILLRDTITIGTIACAAKILQQVFAKACTKVSGLALAIKPNGVNKDSTLAKIWSYLRPVKGHQVLNSEQLQTKYTNIEKYDGGAAGFARFIDEQGGDIKKAFNADKRAKCILRKLYNKSSIAEKVAFADAGNKDIIAALEDMITNNKDVKTLEKLYKRFGADKNKFLAKAKSLNSSFNFAVLFGVVPLILGYLIPAFNESLTKKREIDKNKAKINEQGSTSANQNQESKSNKSAELQSVSSKVQFASTKESDDKLKVFAAFNEIVHQ